MRQVLVAIVILLLPAWAGCVGGDDAIDAAAADDDDALNDSAPSDFALPEERGQSAAAAETNKTEQGVGGIDHKHDYWQGADQAMLFDETIRSSLYPFFPNGPNSQPAGVFYVELDDARLVYEGAERVAVTLTLPDEAVPGAITMQYLTAASSEWTSKQTITSGQTVEIPVAPRETDMPHSTHSLWNWRFIVEHPPTIFFDEAHINIIAYRGREVVDWPGHPDFYADHDERILFQGAATTIQYGFPENALYEGGEDWVHPDLLISHGTGWLDVWVNITAFRSDNPTAIPSEYYLQAHNATDLGIVCCDQDSFGDVDGNNDLKSYHFRVPISIDAMDGPYQPASRWGFRVPTAIGAQDPTSGDGIGFSDGASYEVDYDMTIIAHKAEDGSATPPDMSEDVEDEGGDARR